MSCLTYINSIHYKIPNNFIHATELKILKIPGPGRDSPDPGAGRDLVLIPVPIGINAIPARSRPGCYSCPGQPLHALYLPSTLVSYLVSTKTADLINYPPLLSTTHSLRRL